MGDSVRDAKRTRDEVEGDGATSSQDAAVGSTPVASAVKRRRVPASQLQTSSGSSLGTSGGGAGGGAGVGASPLSASAGSTASTASTPGKSSATPFEASHFGHKVRLEAAAAAAVLRLKTC